MSRHHSFYRSPNGFSIPSRNCELYCTLSTFSQKDLEEAVTSAAPEYTKYKTCDYYTARLTDRLTPYKMSLPDIIENSKAIVKELDGKKFIDFNIESEPLNKSLLFPEYIRQHTKYSKRQSANKLLFERLEEENIITSAERQKLGGMADIIIRKTYNSKAVMLKHQVAGRKVNADIISQDWRESFKTEQNMWRYFIDCVS